MHIEIVFNTSRKNVLFLFRNKKLYDLNRDFLTRWENCIPVTLKLTKNNALICDALRDLVPFVQFKKHEKQPRRCVIFSKDAG